MRNVVTSAGKGCAHEIVHDPLLRIVSIRCGSAGRSDVSNPPTALLAAIILYLVSVPRVDNNS
jgi:hypothetical protein